MEWIRSQGCYEQRTTRSRATLNGSDLGKAPATDARGEIEILFPSRTSVGFGAAPKT